jgi:hypothetical protein
MSDGAWLIDKSALVRVADSTDIERVEQPDRARPVRITNVTRLEIGHPARTGSEAAATSANPHTLQYQWSM